MIPELDPEKVLAPIFGGVLFVAGLLAMWLHGRAWHGQQTDPEAEEADRAHYRARYRRRMQVSGMICLLGVMIAVGDALVPWQRAPALFAVYWLVVLIVAVWMLMLGVADMYATSAHTRAAMARIRAKQRVLEQQLAETARREGYEGFDGNGHADVTG